MKDTMGLLQLENPSAKKAKAKAKWGRIITKRTPHEYTHKAQSTMEEMMTTVALMMKIRSTHEIPSLNSPDQHHHHHHHQQPCNHNNNFSPPICPAWKLYENPFYISSNHKPYQNNHVQDCAEHELVHRLHLPVSARKLAASFWDLAFIRPAMESELEKARAQIAELKNELEIERKGKRKSENLNKKLARELSEERKARQALEKLCEELAKEITSDKAEIARMRHEFEEERKMLRTAEVIREERVQMKLAEAKILLEEKFSELEIARKIGGAPESSGSWNSNNDAKIEHCGGCQGSIRGKLRVVLGEKKQQQALDVNPTAENPHIRRGIKGFVEFPKVVRAIGCRSGKHLGSKFECQKAQLKILLKQKGPVRINGLITS